MIGIRSPNAAAQVGGDDSQSVLGLFAAPAESIYLVGEGFESIGLVPT
ncbi:3-phosphoshikimate 1-carboxyvinyltransferase domain protein [Mycobacteroides abscessus 1948]|uniref:3-phosphoshikimate 1-carboxyvinyltransferase domain protein n=1 Tax=Mycobacteroides abscessus 1948 TaxID=1299323 RepID=A0A829QH09_9MYCO|nr:3-phosphoshikimate 1-carboxyvinyltransferase domain protein [Mycobacteroides abscessus 1948]SKV82705.1 Uncharacterised protein [Mycobacteroides abscessus subsp. abscessus]